MPSERSGGWPGDGAFPDRGGAGTTRRRVLAAGATGALAAVSGLAGCQGGGSERARGTRRTDEIDGAGIDHPAAAALQRQPRLGPPAGESEATVVLFEDPSCPVCRAFDERTMPKLRERLLDPGTVSLYAREYPVVAAWSHLGARLLEAAYARSADAFWNLRSYYFSHQAEIDSESVYARTSQHLSAATNVDAEAAVGAVKAGRFDDAVATDADAADRAGVRGTPTLFLFADGQFRTKIAGAPSYDLLARSLGV
ncbi:MAG: DsbA family protein [Haloarculaceae archaeon]